jgi:hypothetical protein
MVVSLLLVAALQTVAAARSGEYKLAERNRALLLAQDLMAEILQQAYADPAYGPGSFGLGADEVTGNRSLFDDVDDYDGWQASPPQNKDGSVIPWATGYKQAVSVMWVVSGSLSTRSLAETGIKRIEVTVERAGRPVVVLDAYRTTCWIDPAGP